MPNTILDTIMKYPQTMQYLYRPIYAGASVGGDYDPMDDFYKLLSKFNVNTSPQISMPDNSSATAMNNKAQFGTIGMENQFNSNLLYQNDGTFSVDPEKNSITQYPDTFKGSEDIITNTMKTVAPTILGQPDTTVEGGGQNSNDSDDDKKKSTFKGVDKEQMKAYGDALASGMVITSNLLNKWHPVENSAAYNTGINYMKNSKNGFVRSSGAILDGLNNITSSKSKDFKADTKLESQVGSAYGGAYNKIHEAEDVAGKRYGGLSGIFGMNAGKANKKIDKGQFLERRMSEIRDSADMVKSLAADPFGRMRRIAQLIGKKDPSVYAVHKQGGVLQELAEVVDIKPTYEIIDVVDIEPTTEVKSFQKGGTFNVIPEGALHARKHRMDIEGITKKGIPVVSVNKDGELEQQAEIEHSELIFRLSVTEQIEDLQKKYEESKDDQYAIEAGKLLTDEILNNTQDRTNLLNNEQTNI